MGDRSLFFRSFGEPGPDGTLVFVHATGLNASAYTPLLRDLPFKGTRLAFSMRGHGATDLDADPRALRSWQTFADDLVAELATLELQGPLVLAGHSAGAVTALLTARAVEAHRVLMMDPVVLPTALAYLARTPLKRFTLDRIPIARQAAARRNQFESRQEAEKGYRNKSFFKNWDPEALAGYLDEGLRAAADGSVRLSCDPAYEAACFSAQGAGFWPHLKAVVGKGTQVHMMAAEKASTFPVFTHGRARKLGAEVDMLSGNHMLPVECPDKVAAWMLRALQP